MTSSLVVRRFPWLALGWALAMALSGCAGGPSHPGLRGLDLPPLVPAHAYVADLGFNDGYRISPDGRRLAWQGRSGGGAGVFVRDLAGGKARRVAKGGGWPVWAGDSRHLLLARAGHDERPHVFQIDVEAGDGLLKDLTPDPGRSAYVVGTVDGSADLLITSNRRNPERFDLYRFRDETGELVLIAEDPGDVTGWAADGQGRLHGRIRQAGETLTFERPVPAGASMAWQPSFSWSGSERVQLLQTEPDGASAWALSNRGRDKLALVRLDLGDGRETVVHADPRVDLDSAVISRVGSRPLWVTLEPGYPEAVVLDEAWRDVPQKLTHEAHARILLSSLSRDEKTAVFRVVDAQGGRSVLYDVRQGRVIVLGELKRSRLGQLGALPVQRPVSFTSRDGLPLQGYLTLPSSAPAAGGLPTVMLVHGGPWLRDVWASDEIEALFLANRGYAVLQVNFRGSDGYGRAFKERSIGEWGGSMQDDLIDGLDWLVAQGIADPERVAIVGGSYGGYAALMGTALAPARFACAIDSAGPTDLPRLVETAPPRAFDMLHRYVGDPRQPESRRAMEARSPLFLAGRVASPLLIFHGVDDPRVTFDQAARMVDALRKANKPVEFVAFDAGHGLDSWGDRLKYLRKSEDFLQACLGGRSGGFDYYELAAILF